MENRCARYGESTVFFTLASLHFSLSYRNEKVIKHKDATTAVSEVKNMVLFKGGRAVYGEAIGILLFDTKYPKIPGDVGNATTYPFPVRLKAVKGSVLGLEGIRKHDPTQLKAFIEDAMELESDGVRAITTSCGFNIVFQDDLANAVNIPVFASSLLQLPLVQKMLPKGKKIGIITSNSKLFFELKDEILSKAGVNPSTPVAIAGLEDEKNLANVTNEPFLDFKKAESDVVKVAKKLVLENPDVGAIQLECHNLPPYGKALQDATGLPIFDILTLVDLIYGATVKKRYTGFL